MLTKLMIYGLTLVYVNGIHDTVIRYPVRVDPQICPNYPNCGISIVQQNDIHQSQLQLQTHHHVLPQFYSYLHPSTQVLSKYHIIVPIQELVNIPYTSDNPQDSNGDYEKQSKTLPNQTDNIQSALDKGTYIGDGDYHGEGLAEALTPGYESQFPNYDANENNTTNVEIQEKSLMDDPDNNIKNNTSST